MGGENGGRIKPVSILIALRKMNMYRIFFIIPRSRYEAGIHVDSLPSKEATSYYHQ